MMKTPKNTLQPESLAKVVGEYANLISAHGIDSEEVRKMRKDNSNDKEFLAYADAFDRLARSLKKEQAAKSAVAA